MNFWFYPIDWSATGSMFTGAGTIGLAAAALFATRVWRQQQREARISQLSLTCIANSSEILDFISRQFEFSRKMSRDAPINLVSPTTSDFIKMMTLAKDPDDDIVRFRSLLQNLRESAYHLSAISGEIELDAILRFVGLASSYFNQRQMLVRNCEFVLSLAAKGQSTQAPREVSILAATCILDEGQIFSKHLTDFHQKFEPLLKPKISI